jgi:hypothetical protein
MPRYRHDLTEFVDFLRDWLAGYNLGEPGHYTRHLHRDGYDSSRSDAYGCADAANILAMLGELPSDPVVRTAWVSSLQSFQRTDGVFVNDSHSCYHTTAHVTAALELFDARPTHPLAFLAELADHDRLRRFLDELDWDRPWPASHDAAGAASALAITGEVGPDWFAAYFDWFDAEVDPATGLWRRGRMLPADEWPGFFANLGGSFHYHFVYDYLRQPWPAVDRLIDSCLVLLYESAGRFALDTVGFAEIDLIFCLSRARRQTAYRFDEVGTALGVLLDRVVAKLTEDDYRASAAFDDVHSTFGAVCAVAELQRALPGSIMTPVPLRLVLDRRPFI